jgi:hypothetical protein
VEMQEILAKFERFNPNFPRVAVNEAMARKEEIAPELLKILENFSGNMEQFEEDYHAHIYAIYLLAYFQEPRAYPLIVKAVAGRTEDELELFFGDFITEDLSRALASVCDGDLSLIKELIEDENNWQYVRSAALRSLLTLFAQGELLRSELVDYLKSLFDKLERKSSNYELWSNLVCTCCYIHPRELYPQITQVFADDLVAPFYINMEDVNDYLRSSQEDLIHDLKRDRNYTFIGNTVTELGSWACFNRPTPKKHSQGAQTKKRKIGRNEPCPCGSGKKYKKCCGR